MTLQPQVPGGLHPLAREILEELARHPGGAGVIVGGGVALQHYCEYRDTVDLDAWWAQDAGPDAEIAVRDAMEAVAQRHDLEVVLRAWRETQSFEFREPEGHRKRFSFQIARRTIELSPPVESAWPPVRLEGFVDNLAAKMSALVDRGAPRDFLDVYEVCRRSLADVSASWQLWSRKNPGRSRTEARVQVLHHLEALEARRPLASIEGAAERDSAATLRGWVRSDLCGRDEHGD